MHASKALRTIALIEAAKGSLVLLAGFGLLALVHHDLQRFVERLVVHAHLNPASAYPRIFLDLAGQLTDTRLMLLASGAALYALVRFIEAYGLWHARPWAQWFAAISGGIYIPIELFELVAHATWISAVSLGINVAIVAFMLHSVRNGRSEDP